MRLIIAGSRDFLDYDFLERRVLEFIKKHRKGQDSIEIVCGRASGADTLGEKFADKYGLKKHPFPAEWHIHGKSAGYKRNEVMAQVATHCIIFWNGLSPGSRHMKDIAVKKKLVVEVVDV